MLLNLTGFVFRLTLTSKLGCCWTWQGLFSGWQWQVSQEGAELYRVCFQIDSEFGQEVAEPDRVCFQVDSDKSVRMLLNPPEGRPGMSDVSPLSGISGLSFDSTLLSPLLFFCLVLLPFCLIVFCLLALSFQLFPENSSIFFVKR